MAQGILVLIFKQYRYNENSRTNNEAIAKN